MATMTIDTAVDAALYADGTLGVEDAQEFSGLGRTFLYDLMETGRLPYSKVGTRRLIPKRALVKLLAEGGTVQPVAPARGKGRKG